MNLSPRLKLISDTVKGRSVADIGTDHGKLVIELVSCGRVSYAVASDVGEGPVSACEKNVRLAGLADSIHIRLGNGLDTISSGEVETIVIAGMGGELISQIIQRGAAKILPETQLVLQPMTGADVLRIYLSENGYIISDEQAIAEEDKIYTVISAYVGKSKAALGADAIISDALLKHKDLNTFKYIERELYKLNKKLKGLKNAAEPDEKLIFETAELIREVEKKYELAKNN